ncbi:hypothetical protein HD597_003209 [Nonomuraea thailandensis]|uniref:Uncharacterized protein n=1 Tax=Nonomuraea thailandensis TaxID=1188745 RepID=A0A9X2GBL6_9ACTN|nr:hypothetical protein [Nonomuraea thailandensis]MCP2356189.1 hypothetical protein [Nonomuraea thailandensis]
MLMDESAGLGARPTEERTVSRLRCHISISLDGLVAGPGQGASA